MFIGMNPRAYRQRARAASHARTREQILDATIALHDEVGFPATTIAAIADRAGVQRLTVYRHFPNDGTLIEGCATRWHASHPLPTDRWSAIADPRQRVRVALDALYGYYSTAETTLAQLIRERERIPLVGGWLEPYDRLIAGLRERLAEGWGLSGRPSAWVDALVAHVLRVDTWRSLVQDAGLEPADAARLMARSVSDLARDPYA
jgi:AcrR family transcriptional regulator